MLALYILLAVITVEMLCLIRINHRMSKTLDQSLESLAEMDMRWGEMDALLRASEQKLIASRRRLADMKRNADVAQA